MTGNCDPVTILNIDDGANQFGNRTMPREETQFREGENANPKGRGAGDKAKKAKREAAGAQEERTKARRRALRMLAKKGDDGLTGWDHWLAELHDENVEIRSRARQQILDYALGKLRTQEVSGEMDLHHDGDVTMHGVMIAPARMTTEEWEETHGSGDEGG